MRLTKQDKETFLVNLMADVKKINYRDQLEGLVKAEAIEQLPPPIKEMLKTNKELLPFLATRYNRSSYYTSVSNVEYELSPHLKKKCDALETLREAQEDSRRQVKAQMAGIIKAFTTVAALEKALPELAQYLPVTTDPLKNLPISDALANLMTAGWKPKGRK